MATPPTYPDAKDLVEGTGTRSFAAVTTQAGDYLLVETVFESGSGTPAAPTCAGLVFSVENTVQGVSVGDDVEITHYVAPDATGASRTVQCQANGALAYRARLTVVRGSGGPGTGKGTSSTAQTVLVTREGDNSGIFMSVGDWSAGALGSPAWTPGGSTTASQQGTQATYIFGRWDDSGAAGTASHGISSPSYGTPSIAVLELLGVTGGAAPELSSPIPALPASLLLLVAALNQNQWTPGTPEEAGVTQSIDGSATSDTSATATLTATEALVAAASSTTSAAGAVTLTGALVGAATSTTSAAADLVRVTPIAGAATSSTSASAALTVVIVHLAAGNATSTTSAVAVLGIVGPVAGASTSTSSAAAALTMTGALAGAATSTTTAAASLTRLTPVAGAASSTTSAAAALVLVVLHPIDGAATSTTSAAAALAVRGAVTGGASSTIMADAVLTLRLALVGAGTSTTTASAALTRVGAIAGTASSVTTAAGALTVETGILHAADGAALTVTTAAAALYLPPILRPDAGLTVRPFVIGTDRPASGLTGAPASGLTYRPVTTTTP